jgi:hypothetical protein
MVKSPVVQCHVTFGLGEPDEENDLCIRDSVAFYSWLRMNEQICEAVS